MSESIQKAIVALESLGSSFTEVEEGELLFKELKIVISDAERMGGDGDDLAYVYLASSIDHLLGDDF